MVKSPKNFGFTVTNNSQTDTCNSIQTCIYCLFSGKLRYANNSNYKNDTMIRKEVC